MRYLYGHADHRDLHSFPTRRSSDLVSGQYRRSEQRPLRSAHVRVFSRSSTRKIARSEEHTSELQSRFDIVCCLMLEKKKLMYSNVPTTAHSPVNRFFTISGPPAAHA